MLLSEALQVPAKEPLVYGTITDLQHIADQRSLARLTVDTYLRASYLMRDVLMLQAAPLSPAMLPDAAHAAAYSPMRSSYHLREPDPSRALGSLAQKQMTQPAHLQGQLFIRQPISRPPQVIFTESTTFFTYTISNTACSARVSLCSCCPYTSPAIVPSFCTRCSL